MATRSLSFLKPTAAVGLAMLVVGLVMTVFDFDPLTGRVFMFIGVIDLLAAFVLGRYRRGGT
ncbi:MAG: hypothetical protein GXP36_09775 [Actinobacteria bacterium]|nr:hypothetical protein [Actinomycetota bacterium]